MEHGGIPALAGRVPAQLFAPLSSPLAPIHWSLLAAFYYHEFEREPFHLVKPAALDLAEELLHRSGAWDERRQELLADVACEPGSQEDDAEALRATARRIVSRLEQAGWYRFEYRAGVGEVLSFFPYAARLLETLVRIARDEQPIFQGYAHTIAALLKPDAVQAQPGAAIREAKRHTLELVRELKILDRNIADHTQRLLDEAESAAVVLEQSLDHYDKAVQASYHRLKTAHNLFKWRGDVLRRLDAIAQDRVAMEAAERWYAEHLAGDGLGHDHLASDLRTIRLQFESIPEITADIDRRNARFSGTALRKLMYLLRQDRRTEGQLQYLVDRLAVDDAPELVFDVFRCELLADGFFYTSPRRRERVGQQQLGPRTDDDRVAVRSAVARRLVRRYSRALVDAWVLEQLRNRQRTTLAQTSPTSDEDYVRLLYACAYALDGGSPYDLFVESNEPVESVGGFGLPRAWFHRRRGRTT